MTAIALPILLLAAGLLSSTSAHAVDSLTGGHGGKLNDKYLAGHAGGRLGIGGTEPVVKIPSQKKFLSQKKSPSQEKSLSEKK